MKYYCKLHFVFCLFLFWIRKKFYLRVFIHLHDKCKRSFFQPIQFCHGQLKYSRPCSDTKMELLRGRLSNLFYRMDTLACECTFETDPSVALLDIESDSYTSIWFRSTCCFTEMQEIYPSYPVANLVTYVPLSFFNHISVVSLDSLSIPSPLWNYIPSCLGKSYGSRCCIIVLLP